MIIGLAGAARSGKDTVANFFDKHLGGIARVQIAGPLKAFLRDTFDWTEAHTDGDLKEVPDTRYPRETDFHESSATIFSARLQDHVLQCSRCGETLDPSDPFKFGDRTTFHNPSHTTWRGKCVVYLTPREVMQWLGNIPFYGAIWAERGAREAKLRADAGVPVVVTDCRYLRDIQALKNVGGIIVQVHREGAGLAGSAAQHPSEVERSSDDFQRLVSHHIYNDGTLDDLEAKTVEVLSQLSTRVVPA